eukprot:TRINITY_DN9114_c0_g1_i1.p1 TRINITY_DN9114_c0_g1~~TRINITY_DN9114_c0_g1_i1.p1  ORF type:complete len:365 (-),score=66.95 TRINITY_DN9114_c0_g1_i1:345-1439(-)
MSWLQRQIAMGRMEGAAASQDSRRSYSPKPQLHCARVLGSLAVLSVALWHLAEQSGLVAFCNGANTSPSMRQSFRSARQSKLGRAGTATADLYEVLKIDKESSFTDIKKAYYREAKASHPDTHGGSSASDDIMARFQQVSDAYATLADPVRRQAYDLRGLAALAEFESNATRLFGPPPWRVLIGRTDHWAWDPEKKEYMIRLLASSIPHGIAGVTVKTLTVAYEETLLERVGVLLERVSEPQAKDTVKDLEAYGLAVKAEPLEGERHNEDESPLMHFRRVEQELMNAAEILRKSSIDMHFAKSDNEGYSQESEDAFEDYVRVVRQLRSELRAAAQGLEEGGMQVANVHGGTRRYEDETASYDYE